MNERRVGFHLHLHDDDAIMVMPRTEIRSLLCTVLSTQYSVVYSVALWHMA